MFTFTRVEFYSLFYLFTPAGGHVTPMYKSGQLLVSVILPVLRTSYVSGAGFSC